MSFGQSSSGQNWVPIPQGPGVGFRQAVDRIERGLPDLYKMNEEWSPKFAEQNIDILRQVSPDFADLQLELSKKYQPEYNQLQLDQLKDMAPKYGDFMLDYQKEYTPKNLDWMMNLQNQYRDQLAENQNLNNAMTSELANEQRKRDIEMIGQLGPELKAAIEKSDPTGAAIEKTLANQIQSELELGSRLSPDIRRELQQSIRTGQAARGMTRGNAPLSEESFMAGERANQMAEQRKNRAFDYLQMPKFNAYNSLLNIGNNAGNPMSALGSASQPTGVNMAGANAQMAFNPNTMLPSKQQLAPLETILNYQNNLNSMDMNQAASGVTLGHSRSMNMGLGGAAAPAMGMVGGGATGLAALAGI